MWRRVSTMLLVSLCLGAIALPAGEPPADQGQAPRKDRLGDPLPPRALDRLGTVRLGDGRSVAFSPDGKTLASGGEKIRLWDLATGKETHSYVIDKDAYKYGPHAIAFSPDGKKLACACDAVRSTYIKFLDLESGKVGEGEFAGEWLTVGFVFSPDGKTLISADFDSISVWDTATGKFSGRLDTAAKKNQGIHSLALSPDGKVLAVTTGFGDTIVLWDLAAKKKLRSWEGKGCEHMAFSPDGKTLVSACKGKSLRLWDPATGKELSELKGHTDAVNAVAFSPDGKRVASAGDDSTIRLWDPVSGKETKRFGDHVGGFSSLAFSPDGKLLAAGGSRITVWDVETGKERIPTPGHKKHVYHLALSPDGKTLASTASDDTLRLWDLAAGKEVRQFTFGQRWSGTAAFSPDGKVVAWHDDNTLLFTDATMGKELRRCDTGGFIWSVAFSPAGTLVATGHDDNTIRLWDWTTGKAESTFRGKGGAVFSLAFSPDGKTLAAGLLKSNKDDNADVCTTALWDVATGKELRQLKIDPAGARHIAFAPNGRYLAVAREDHGVTLWDIGTGKEVRSFDADGATVFQVAFSPDGQTVAGAVQDRTVRVWEVATGKERCRFDGHRGWVMSVAFTGDGRRVISGSDDTTCLVWDVTGLMTDKGLRAADPSPETWDSLWKTMAERDAGKAHQVVWTMIAARQTVAMLQERLRPVPALDAKQLADLFAQLDSDDFEAREQATLRLDSLEEAAETALRRLLEKTHSAEVKRRVEDLLGRLDDLLPEHLRTLRALEVLEQIGTRQARKVLQTLAAGAPEARVTRETKAALDRLEKRVRNQ